MPQTTINFGRISDEPGPGIQGHPVADRVNRVSAWLKELFVRNAACDEEDVVVQVTKTISHDTPQEVKEGIDEKREEGEWDGETPYIEDVQDVTVAFPFATPGMKLNGTDQGLWFFELSTGTRVATAHAPLNLDSDHAVTTLVAIAATEEGLGEYDDAISGVNVGPELEREIYSASVNMYGLILNEDVELQETPPIHPKAEPFFRSVEHFFENTDPYLRFGQPGMRAWLLYGTYGTGKSTIVYELARRKEGECAVVFVEDENALRTVAEVAADQSVPTIIVISEAEMILNDADGSAPSEDARSVGASQQMLNFLDGIDQPRNKAGTALVMTTNRPNRISNRILKRTGRINERIRIGALEGECAAECARLFLPENAEVSDETIIETVGGRVGDDIRDVADRTVHIAIEQGKEIVDDEVFEETARQVEEAMREIEDFDGLEDESHDYGDGTDDTGFTQPNN